MKKIETIREITVELDNGQKVTVDVTALFVYDSNYGADADGNRGVGLWSMDGYNYETPRYDDDGHLITEKSDDIDEAINRTIDNLDFDEFFSEDESKYSNADMEMEIYNDTNS